ncbi:autophagy protein 13 [Lecanicillium sp. MT-2017a]|nr:autophagy protein 13 [Lecanicillium sp. MT-2017a]
MASPTSDSQPTLGLPSESVKKLDQIVQYQIETDEIDDFREELKTWKACGSLDNLPPPMIIEVYLDTSTLKDSQSLVIVDDDGKRWDVMEQLHTSRLSTESSSSGAQGRSTEVVLERWRVDLKPNGANPVDDFGPILPTIYKKAIVFFRSLFITTRLLPAWKFSSQGLAKGCHPALATRCRIRMSEPQKESPDTLKSPIDGRSDPVTEYMFGDLEVPVGRLSTSVTYRNDCSFRIDDSESLLSSRFMGVDENFFKPSVPQRIDSTRHAAGDVGSLRDRRTKPDLSDVHQTYGSLSTFHGDGPLGTSPMSALRAVKPPGSDTSSPPASLPAHQDFDVPHSMPIGNRSAANHRSTRSGETARRPSISFQPFKAGSLPAEEDNISEFLKILDSKRTLKSFEPAKRGESSTNKTVAQLSRFHMMKESNLALTESMTSSMQLQRSSSSSSRQLTSVPGMVAPASASPSSSSPGKPISPHTPAIPSRLSENSIVDNSDQRSRTVSRSGRPREPSIPEPRRQSTITQEGTTAIDIPLSPRLSGYQRRSSSVAQQSRATADEEETDLAFANRSISLGADDREPPTMSTLLGRQMHLEEESTVRESPSNSLQPAAEIQSSSASAAGLRSSAEETPPDGLIAQSSSPFPRRRYAGMGVGRGQTPPQSSRGSYIGSSSRLVRGDDESVGDEPLMFTLSEMDAQGRRSLEEGAGSTGTGGNLGSERGGFEARGTSRRGW